MLMTSFSCLTFCEGLDDDSDEVVVSVGRCSGGSLAVELLFEVIDCCSAAVVMELW